MRKLSKLLNIIDNFYKGAIQLIGINKRGQSEGFYMPDDEDAPESNAPKSSGNDLYKDLVSVSQRVTDKNLTYDLGLLAKMYAKAIEINGGFAAISNAINNVFSEYLEDADPESEDEVSAVEDILNAINNDIRQRAGGKIPKNDEFKDIEALKKVRHDYQFGGEDLADEAEQIDSERGIAPEETGFEAGVFDPTGGMGQEEARKGKGRGFYFSQIKEHKNWAQRYFDEAQRYQDLLEYELNPITRKQLAEQIELLKKLSNNAYQQKILFEKVQAAGPGVYPEEEQKLQDITNENKVLLKATSSLNFTLRKARFASINERLKSVLNHEKDPYERLLIEQTIEKNNLLASRDLNKHEELKLRRALVRILKGEGLKGKSQEGRPAWWKEEDEFDPTKRSRTAKDIIDRYLSQIEEAKKKTKRLSDVHVERAAKVRELKKSGSLAGAIVILGQNIASKKNDLKKPIKKKLVIDLKKNAAAHFKHIVDAINNAASQNNQVLIAKLEKDLDKAVSVMASEIADNDPKIQAFVKSVKEVYDFRDVCEGLVVALDAADSDTITSIISNTINIGNNIVKNYGSLPVYRSTTKSIQDILDILEEYMNNLQEESSPDTIREVQTPNE